MCGKREEYKSDADGSARRDGGDGGGLVRRALGRLRAAEDEDAARRGGHIREQLQRALRRALEPLHECVVLPRLVGHLVRRGDVGGQERVVCGLLAQREKPARERRGTGEGG